MPRSIPFLPEEVTEHIVSYIDSNQDLNNVSLVSKLWYEIDRRSRRSVCIPNRLALCPRILTSRFGDVRSVSIKGEAVLDFEAWGTGVLYPWVLELAEAYPMLEELRVKRMEVSDHCLEIISKSFPNFNVLVLNHCRGFTSDGLAFIAANCRKLRVLDLKECRVEQLGTPWFPCLSESCTTLESIDIACLDRDVHYPFLRRLVGSCPRLKTLRFHKSVSYEKIPTLLQIAPQLDHLGAASFDAVVDPELQSDLVTALSGELGYLVRFSDRRPAVVPMLYTISPRVTFLNLTNIPLLFSSDDLLNCICPCENLQRLWVLDNIEDSGLYAIAAACKKMKQLKVFTSYNKIVEPNVWLTEKGLVFVSDGCPNLTSITYHCRQMTNAALLSVGRSHPDMNQFHLSIAYPCSRDYKTMQPLNDGFGAIVQHCKDLQRLTLSGLLTDTVFECIGACSTKLEVLSVAFAGNSDLGLHSVLSGCQNLRKLEIRNCPFGDTALLANMAKLETMQSLWMSSCNVTFGACKLLARNMPRLNVDVIDERYCNTWSEDSRVAQLCIYRTLAGPRVDMPGFVFTIKDAD